MRIEDKQELKSVYKALKIFFSMNDTTLFEFCNQNSEEFPFRRTYERLTRNSITNYEVDSMIKVLDDSKSLTKVNGVWKIV
jgi:hypothetical protein